MNAITYPARPINGGRLEKAPPKSRDWFFEPKYNGWRTLVHAPTGTMFNRYGERLTIESDFSHALALLQKTPFEWLDCEALERRHQIGRGTLLVFDWVDSRPFETRKEALQEVFPLHHFGEKPEHQTVYAVKAWSSPEKPPLELYQSLRALNAAWRCEFYEGLVFKRANLPYPVQRRSPTIEFAGWMKHRWA
jgi:ATP-dependent DNA ligase